MPQPQSSASIQLSQQQWLFAIAGFGKRHAYDVYILVDDCHGGRRNNEPLVDSAAGFIVEVLGKLLIDRFARWLQCISKLQDLEYPAFELD